MKSILLSDVKENLDNVFSDKVIEELKATAGLDPQKRGKQDIIKAPDAFCDTEYIFSTWGMPQLTAEEIKKYFPSLKCVFYAAGTVQYFARPFLECGIRVFSAWAANAVPVAEYTLSQILLANKGFFKTCLLQSRGNTALSDKLKPEYRGNYGCSVGIIGAGMIGSMVAELLKGYKLSVKVFDPFLSDERARELNVEKCGLRELFASCQTVSNHLANNAQTKGMLGYELFSSMPPYATFINTGRGAQVIEDELVRALSERPDLTAVLDVTEPEPPKQGHAFYSLDNCFLTPHIAGSIGDEVCRMAEYMAEEYSRFISGGKCLYEVTPKMLETMA